jgi:hypothetical protein
VSELPAWFSIRGQFRARCCWPKRRSWPDGVRAEDTGNRDRAGEGRHGEGRGMAAPPQCFSSLTLSMPLASLSKVKSLQSSSARCVRRVCRYIARPVNTHQCATANVPAAARREKATSGCRPPAAIDGGRRAIARGYRRSAAGQSTSDLRSAAISASSALRRSAALASPNANSRNERIPDISS